MPVFSDYREVLVCEADGNPRPEVIWIFNNKSSKGANLTISTEMAGLITCSARNIHGNVSKTVELVPTGKKKHILLCKCCFECRGCLQVSLMLSVS